MRRGMVRAFSPLFIDPVFPDWRSFLALAWAGRERAVGPFCGRAAANAAPRLKDFGGLLPGAEAPGYPGLPLTRQEGSRRWGEGRE
jgi:hypothetical protein